MSKRNVHGWDHLAGDQASTAAARQEVLEQLRDVPTPHRDNWERRLKSKGDHPHFSVRLELYLHRFFDERGWKIDIEPELQGTPNRPEFLLRRGVHELMVEAKTLMNPQPVAEQDVRLATLADGLTKRLTRTVRIHALSDLPSSLPNRQIASQIEKMASGVGLNQEFRIEGEHQGDRYDLEVAILLEDKPTETADVGIIGGEAREADVGRRMRKEIVEKAGKYGDQGIPFVIVIWPQTWLYEAGPCNDDFLALVGDKEWVESTPGNTRFNGVFSRKRHDGTHRYSHVSAVAVYRFLFDSAPPYTGRSSLCVYHNPYAERPLDISIFEGQPQGIVNRDTAKLEWIQEPQGG